MRKSAIVHEVKYFYDLLKLEKGADRIYAGTSYKVINNWSEVSVSLHKLNEYGFIGDSVLKIFNLGPNFQASEKTLSVAERDYAKFLALFDIVRAKCEAIIASNSYDTTEDDVLFMRLPDNISDLEELSSMISDLEKSFNKCPILREKAGVLKFKRVEEGSNWLVFTITAVVAGGKALNWIANFISKCNEIRIQNRTIASMDLDNLLKRFKVEEAQKAQYIKNYQESETEEIKNVCITNFKQIDSKEFGEISPEDETKIVYSMKTLINVLEKGAEFYPSSNVSTDTAKLFPKQEEFKKLETAKKLLEESKEK